MKPCVNGKMETLRELIAVALPCFGQRERIIDARRCRRVMKTYRSIASRGELATADCLNLWDKVHCKHRDVHDGEIAALKIEAGMQVQKRDRKIAEKMMTQATTDASMKFG